MESFRTLNNTPKTNQNPASKFLEWKSNEKCFAYYDKQKKENVLIDLPIKIQFLEEFHTVKGWNDKNQTGIYSNEVKFISTEPLTVKMFNGMEVATGLYNDIRLKIIDAGGKYHKSVYCLLNGELVNLQMKGAVVASYGLFANGDKLKKINGNSNTFESNFIEINSFEELKKGATKYTVPVFQKGSVYSKEDLQKCIDAYKIVSDYYNKYTTKNIEVVDAEVVPSDDLEF